MKRADKRRNEGPQFSLDKALADTASGTTQECQVRVITRYTTGVIVLPSVSVDPPPGVEQFGGRTPELRRTVDSQSNDHDIGAFRYGMVGNSGGLVRNAHSQRHGRMQSEGFIADGVQKCKGFQSSSQVKVGCGTNFVGNVGADFFSQLQLDGGMGRKDIGSR